MLAVWYNSNVLAQVTRSQIPKKKKGILVIAKSPHFIDYQKTPLCAI